MGSSIEIILHKSGRTIHVPADTSILNALLDAGVDVSFSCGQGICGSCETTLVSGIPDHRDQFLTEAEHAANLTMMICCSRAKSPTLVLDL